VVEKWVRSVSIETAEEVDHLLPSIVRHQRLWGLARHIGIGSFQAILVVIESGAPPHGECDEAMFCRPSLIEIEVGGGVGDEKAGVDALMAEHCGGVPSRCIALHELGPG
jgi:hypothetical protein